jgi:CubicO group peptidase (beta-lactamase class C family)
MSADIIRIASPSAAGVDARGIGRFLDAIEADPDIRPHGLVMLRDGIRIAEGWWAPYRADRAQLLYSVSKSFTATAAGLAWQDGLLDLDAPVLSYFPELDADITDPRSRSMKVRHIAAMASGHAQETIDLAQARDPDNLVRGFLLIPPDAEPGTLLAYNQPCSYTLAAIVQRVTGQSLVEYLRPRLFDPLGIGEVAWFEHPPGRNIGFSGLHATTDAMARLGELYRCGGMWGGRRILDAEWVSLATRAHVATPTAAGVDWQQGYGFQFWMSRHGYRGDGAYGQLCVVVPEAGLVVAMTSETEPMQRVLDALWRHVLPAIDAPADPADDAVLAARLSRLSIEPLSAGSAPETSTEWADRSFPVDPDAAGGTSVATVRVSHAADGWRIVLVDDSGVLDVPFAAGEWRLSEPLGVPVAASGGWSRPMSIGHGELLVEVLFLETPHSLRVRCSPASGFSVVSWVTQPLHSPAPSAQRRP